MVDEVRGMKLLENTIEHGNAILKRLREGTVETTVLELSPDLTRVKVRIQQDPTPSLVSGTDDNFVVVDQFLERAPFGRT